MLTSERHVLNRASPSFCASSLISAPCSSFRFNTLSSCEAAHVLINRYRSPAVFSEACYLCPIGLKWTADSPAPNNHFQHAAQRTGPFPCHRSNHVWERSGSLYPTGKLISHQLVPAQEVPPGGVLRNGGILWEASLPHPQPPHHILSHLFSFHRSTSTQWSADLLSLPHTCGISPSKVFCIDPAIILF